MAISSKPFLCSVIAFVLIATGSSAFARDDFFELSLQDLLKVQIVSKRSENIRNATGVVSVVTAGEIQRFGARHLRDVIDRLPNIQVIGSALYPHNRTSMRGITQTHIDDKILVLLNGRPLRDAGQGGINGDIYSSFPVNLIQQIEVIRGPGSVLYGTNAFGGVINIVTKEAPEETLFQVDVVLGTFDTQELAVSGGGQFNEVDIVASLSSHSSDGDTFSNTAAEIGPSGDYETGRETLESVLQLSYNGLVINTLFNKVLTKSGNNLLSFPSTDWNISRRFIDISYTHAINNEWRATSSVTYNGMTNTAGLVGGTDRFFRTKSRGYLAEVTFIGELTEDLNLVMGAVYDRLKGDNISDGVLNTEIDTWRSSLYSKIDFQINPMLKISGGFQLNMPKDSGSDLSPRLAAIFNLSDNWLLKVAYGEAYRSAFGLDLFLNASFLQGNPDLKPETIDTYSAQIAYNNATSNIALTYYNSRHEDLIIRTINNTGQVTLTNAGYVDYEGVEIEYRWEWYPNWSLLGNASYQTNESNAGLKDATFHPNWMIKGGVSYDQGPYVIGVFASYFGEPTQLVDLNPLLEELNPDADAYLLVTANFSIDVSQWLSIERGDKFTVSVFADNLLDEEVYYPEISRQAVNTVPHHAGRSIHFSASYSF